MNASFSTDHIVRLLEPGAWARATMACKGVPDSTREIAMQIVGIPEEKCIKDLTYNRVKNSGDLMRHERQRALEAQIQFEDYLNQQTN